MPETKELTLGDPCPACGNELKDVPVPSDDEWRKAYDKENPIALQAGSDTASPDVRKQLGTLYRCVNPRCRYQVRFKNGGASTDESKRKK
ncbi:MAG: hypothetical protein AUI15_33845 [Actinobacteria bacterium 13_2_20CM_2_66_6]|nr:MAG: hypothetical protein AUI15_33845 [Actinobacteria bacterium 13_2_20CM_2_66_6]